MTLYCRIGMVMVFPVVHNMPPSNANGSKRGDDRRRLIPSPETQMALQNTNWKNMPSPVSTLLTGTKLEPKNTIDTSAQTYPSTVDTITEAAD